MSEQQKVQHYLYEGEVHVYTEVEDGAGAFVHLADGPNEHGDDFGEHLAWLLGPGRADRNAGSTLTTKQLRIVITDLEPDDVEEHRDVDGDPLNLALATVIKQRAAAYKGATVEELENQRDRWRRLYLDSMEGLRQVYLVAAAYELLSSQAARAEATRNGQVVDTDGIAEELATVERALTGCKRPGCGAAILWLDHARTGKPAPIDADPDGNGNVIIDLAKGDYAVLAGDNLAEAHQRGTELRLNHFVSCKNPPGGQR